MFYWSENDKNQHLENKTPCVGTSEDRGGGGRASGCSSGGGVRRRTPRHNSIDSVGDNQQLSLVPSVCKQNIFSWLLRNISIVYFIPRFPILLSHNLVLPSHALLLCSSLNSFSIPVFVSNTFSMFYVFRQYVFSAIYIITALHT